MKFKKKMELRAINSNSNQTKSKNKNKINTHISLEVQSSPKGLSSLRDHISIKVKSLSVSNTLTLGNPEIKYLPLNFGRCWVKQQHIKTINHALNAAY